MPEEFWPIGPRYLTPDFTARRFYALAQSVTWGQSRIAFLLRLETNLLPVILLDSPCLALPAEPCAVLVFSRGCWREHVSLIGVPECLSGAFISGQVIFFSVALGTSPMCVGSKVTVLSSYVL